MAIKIQHSVSYLRRRLRELADPEHRRSQRRFFKEPVRGLGVRTPDVRRLAGEAAKEYRRAKIGFDELFEIADRLWRRGVLEERVLAVLILSRLGRQLEPGCWGRLDGWVESLSNWGETDGLCTELLSTLLAKEPALVKKLENWAGSSNRWRRRAAAVALVKAARAGQHHQAAIAICDRLAEDRDDMVEKAVGWLLKEMSRTDPRGVAAYLVDNIDRLSRTTVRYACEKLPSELRREVMSA